jgi:hypothetical protein
MVPLGSTMMLLPSSTKLVVVLVRPPHPIPVGEVGRNLVDVDVHAWVDADHVAAALQGDVLHGGYPAVGRVERGRDSDIHTAGIELEPGQRHVVLPADESAQPPVRGVDDRQRGPVAHPPHGAFGTGGHELAMLAKQSAVRPELEDGVVNGGAVRFPLVDAHYDVDAGILGGGAEPVSDRSRHGGDLC